jgi:hypothetical protein
MNGRCIWRSDKAPLRGPRRESPRFCGGWLLGAFIYYFIGSVISRIGSLVIDPIIKKIDFLSFASNEDFVRASKVASNIEVLSEANKIYRAICSLPNCVEIAYGYEAAS